MDGWKRGVDVKKRKKRKKKFDGGWREARIRYGTNGAMVDEKRRGTR